MDEEDKSVDAWVLKAAGILCEASFSSFRGFLDFVIGFISFCYNKSYGETRKERKTACQNVSVST